jgi:hypothetical protein
MSHFAKIENGFVTNVIVAEQDFINAQGGTWVQTSYNTYGGVHYQPNTDKISDDQSKALRKNYAGLGFVYDSTRNAFYTPQPYPSWTLNETTCIWEPPVAYPSDGSFENPYTWDEDTTSWVEVS